MTKNGYSDSRLEDQNNSAYMVTTAYKLLNEGYDVLRLNLRDHGDTQHLNKGNI